VDQFHRLVADRVGDLDVLAVRPEFEDP